MASNFFSLISMADVERVQSAVIAWLFSDSCKALTLQAKLDALNGIFNIGTNLSHIDEIEAQTEFQHMDIVFSLKEKGTIKYILVIENKIKSDQHGNQLQRYGQQVKSFGVPYSLVYLTLLPGTNYYNWNNVPYSKLHSELRAALMASSVACSSAPDYQIAMSYCDSILILAQTAAKAMVNPSMMFSSTPAPYIGTYRLRHVLQVYYFRSVKQHIEKELNAYLQAKVIYQPFKVSVNYGIQSDNAEILVQFTDGYLVDKYLDFGASGKGDFSIAFQSGTFKIAVAKNYWAKDPKDTQLLQSRKLMRTSGMDSIWDTVGKPWRVNAPKNSYARMSISQKAKDLLSLSSDWYLQPHPEFVLSDGFKKCVDQLLTMFP